MNLSRKAEAFSWAVLAKGVLWLVPLGYGAFLIWEERAWRQQVTTPMSAPAPSPVARDVSAPFNPGAVSAVLGLAGEVALASSSEPLELRACFVSSHADSRALLYGNGGERIYRVGDPLPGGSVLRRVESHRVILWRNGREESLSLGPTGSRALKVANANPDPQRPPPAPVYLQPAAAPHSSD